MSIATVNSPAPPLAEEFRLGKWTVNPALNRLRHDSNEFADRHLEPRLMHLLCFLSANPSRVLSRDQLTAELWPRVIVNENSLTRAISELRRQLAVPGHSDYELVQTISKRGYRLVADVQLLLPEQARKAVPKLSRKPGLMSLRALAAGLVFVLTATLLYPPSAPGDGAEMVQASPGWDRVANPVTDLRAMVVAMYRNTDGGFRPLGLEESVPGDPPPVPAVDGRTVAFVRHGSSGSTVFLGSVDAAKSPVAIYNSPELVYHLSWSPVGNGLLLAVKPRRTTPALAPDRRADSRLLLLDLETLEVKVLLDNSGVTGNSPDTAIKLT